MATVSVLGTPGPDLFRPAPNFQENITYIGLGGNDTYYLVTRTYFLVVAGQNLGLRTATTFAQEAAGGGTDTAFLFNSIPNQPIARTLPNVERIIVQTSNSAGNPTDWTVTSNQVNNTITMNAGDDIVKAGGGNDTVQGGAGNDHLQGEAGNDVLFGGAGNDRLAPGTGHDQVHGQGGVDLLSFAEFTASVTVNLVTGAVSTGTTFTGIEGAVGGKGNDIFYVDSQADQIIENVASGTDRVVASRTYALSADANVETLTTTGPTTTTVINLTGSNTANTILGNAAANRINGGGGVDLLSGFGGNDLYFVDNALDVVIEGAGKGTDAVRASVDYVLSASSHVENLQTTNISGTDGIDLTGSNLNNVITGNAGANVLKGLGGNDRIFALDASRFGSILSTDFLYGGLGSDQLSGGDGRDVFVFDTALNATTNVDRILDYSVADDTIQLENAIFTVLPGPTGPRASPRELTADEFHISTSAVLAHDSSDRIIYQQTTGGLFYDRDGDGAALAIRFAQLTAGLALTQADIVVV